MAELRQPLLVVHVVHSFGTGGLENGLVNLINRSPADRYSHAIVCLTESGSFEMRIEKPGIRVISLHRRPGSGLGWYWALLKALKELQPSIVHTRNLSALEGQIPCLLLRDVATVHGVHGRDVFDLDGESVKYNLLRRLIRPLVGAYTTVSRDLKEWLINSIGVPENKITQIYNGVDQTMFSPKSEDRPLIAPAGFLTDESTVVGTVGRLAAVKDQKTLVLAFNQVLEMNPEAQGQLRLIIAGDGPQRDQLEKLIQQLGIVERVWITGERDDIPDILRLLDIFVLPSLGEGVSNTILEAMATGLPIVATSVGGNPELVDEGVNGFLVPRDHPGMLADRIRRLIESPDMRANMGNASLEKVRAEFDWDKTVAGYLAVYDKLTS